jgi:hypothetical protein
VTSLRPPPKLQRFARPSHHVFLRKSRAPARHDDEAVLVISWRFHDFSHESRAKPLETSTANRRPFPCPAPGGHSRQVHFVLAGTGLTASRMQQTKKQVTSSAFRRPEPGRHPRKANYNEI